MNRLRVLIRAFFGFSRTETNAFLILLPLMILLVFSEPLYRHWLAGQPIDRTRDNAKLDSLLANLDWAKDSVKTERELALFIFNPNLATESDFSKLGFEPGLTKRIINYRQKNGKFLVKSDLLKMYGIDTSFYKRLYSFIDLPEKRKVDDRKLKETQRSTIAKIDLNKADTAQLVKVYGIGKKLSDRIVKYRDKLGGFVLPSQLSEVYGLDSIVIARLLTKYFIATDFIPRQLDLNKATETELRTHPYISTRLAKAIIAYRFQHGDFKNVDDLIHIRLFTEAELDKVKAYLTVNR